MVLYTYHHLSTSYGLLWPYGPLRLSRFSRTPLKFRAAVSS
jgi:hypothetical protein